MGREKELPIPENEVERLIALQSYDIIDSGEEKDFDAIASIASAICGTPISLITFIDDKRQWFKSHVGTDLTENFRDLSFCTYAIAGTDEIMIVPDALQDERFANNPVVTDANVTFYAGVPLVNEDGYALGTLCVLDQQPHDFSEAQIDALKALAKQVVDKIELQRKVLLLEKTNQELLNANVLIQKFASMAAHDIKNPLSSINLTSQALRTRQEITQHESCLRLVNMNISAADNLLVLVDEMMAYSKNPALLLEKRQEFNLNTLIAKVVSLLTVPDSIQIEWPAEKHQLYFSIIAMEQILINLLSNAIRYNDKSEGRIQVRFSEDQHYYQLEIQDNGRGIPAAYHDQIFANNVTLQVKDRFNNQGSGIGLATVKDLLYLLGSTITVQSLPGEGATFTVRLKK
ncbi:GAF domain-containing sensor histidine kinase [Mucilaginibacter sp. L3T2-6]|uniref:GAF domain-containing sensor histidine kinase n=1 Tax=Mucilaginibacter sp. L3T2-6 TaxID=3062491 RepID=UPI0026774E0B|nr:GAF domain-containing sensor histidine kinase [Mucilaginibacter sp. L3T2-6]MDO3645245.1 GAF domain-containing sensor histidine kinase [Mucilaginibacter sp. L3T2-6]MDV6217697.1 GAF domain-containing sensor histidine kinase [Mucilaginibacter sp. L3T2-6]